jgi:hypothetical protein
MNQTDRKNLIQESFRLSKRNATCRICGTITAPGNEMLAFRPHGSQDSQANICIWCVETLAEIVHEKKDLNSAP